MHTYMHTYILSLPLPHSLARVAVIAHGGVVVTETKTVRKLCIESSSHVKVGLGGEGSFGGCRGEG